MFSRRAPRRGRRCRGRVGRHALDYEPRLVPWRRRRRQGVKSAHVDADARRDDVVDAVDAVLDAVLSVSTSWQQHRSAQKVNNGRRR